MPFQYRFLHTLLKSFKIKDFADINRGNMPSDVRRSEHSNNWNTIGHETQINQVDLEGKTLLTDKGKGLESAYIGHNIVC